MNNAGLSSREIGRQLGRIHTVISQQTNDVQNNLVKHIHEKTGRYCLLDVAPFPAARSGSNLPTCGPYAKLISGSFLRDKWPTLPIGKSGPEHDLEN